MTDITINPIQVIEVRESYSDQEAKQFIGMYKDAEDCDMILNESADVYVILNDGTKRLLAKFRKSLIPAETVQLGWNSYHKLSQQSRMRGAAAGPLDLSGAYLKVRNLTGQKEYSTSYITKDGKQSKMRINNAIESSVMGFLDTSRLSNNTACRLTAHTAKHLDNYQRGIPFINAIDCAYKLLIPDKHKEQKERADMKPNLRIGDTAFSTVTINRNFRTGCHRDAGDFKNGFGNLTVIERGEYSGGYTMFPQYRIGFNVRSGDVLFMDVHEIHCNTEMYETTEQAEINSKLKQIFKPNRSTGCDKNFTRMSFVCYLREKLINCPD
jgi:hypothetical protein